MVTLVRLVHPLNAQRPIVVTLEGMVTLVMVVSANAPLFQFSDALPISVTGKPLYVAGIITTLFDKLPLLTLYAVPPLINVNLN